MRTFGRVPSDADWQLGFPLGLLQQITAVFKKHHGPHTYGAYSLVNEREVAQALRDKRIEYEFGDVDSGVVIYHDLKHKSKQKDFAGRTVLVKGRVVTSLAASSVQLACTLLDRVTVIDQPTVVEIFEEDRIERDAIAHSAFIYATTKVLAGSEVKGLYSYRNGVYEAPTIPPVEAATLCELDREFMSDNQASLVFRELAGVLGGVPGVAGVDAWAQHYSSYNLRHSWTSFALFGYDPTDYQFIIKPAEMNRAWKLGNPERMRAKPDWTTMARSFPQTVNLIKTWRFAGLDRVRFMRLSGGGELSRHADITHRDAGVAIGKIARLHIPIQTTPYVGFHSWDARGREIKMCLDIGGLYYLDQRKPHQVINASGHDRVHLVLDVVVDSRVREMIMEAAKGHNTEGGAGKQTKGFAERNMGDTPGVWG